MAVNGSEKSEPQKKFTIDLGPAKFIDMVQQTDEFSDESDSTTAFNYDDNRTKFISKMLHQDMGQLDNRNNSYSTLLDDYISEYGTRQHDNRIFKWLFFIIFILIFIFIIGLAAYYIINLISDTVDAKAIVGLITACTTLITTIIVIPKTIAKYLFSIEEDKFMAEIIKAMFVQDDNIRKGIHSESHIVYK